MARRVLFLRNDPTAPAALLGDVFAERGFDVSTFDVVPGDDPEVQVAFPDPDGYDVLVPLGARWAVYDDRLPWVADEMAMVRAALEAGAGVLGVCFGGQLLAGALGGTVQRSPHPEIGWHDVDSVDTELVPPGPWFQWHFDRITAAPAGAVTVARNDRAIQAFARGRALGLQFHPELDAELLELWIDEDRDGDIARLGLHPDELRAHTGERVDDALRRLRRLVDGFLRLPQSTEHRTLRLS